MWVFIFDALLFFLHAVFFRSGGRGGEDFDVHMRCGIYLASSRCPI